MLSPVPLGSVAGAEGVSTAASPPASPPAPAAIGAPLDPDAVEAALAPLLTGGALGPGRSPAHVIDVATGEVLYSAADEPTVPASTMKLVTAVSVLDALGPDTRLRTRVVVVDPAASTPRVILVGAGDPSLRSSGTKVGRAGTSLTPASMEELAAATARALAVRGITRAKVGYDASAFTGPDMHPSWSRSFPAAGVVAPVSALVVDQGRRAPKGVSRVADPAARAGQVFAQQLTAAGITVRGGPKEVEVPDGAEMLASVESPPVGVLVERMLSVSDNDYAEILGRLGAAAGGEPASFAGVSDRAARVLRDLGVDDEGARFADASGLSRRNRLAPSTLTDLLAATLSRIRVDALGAARGGGDGLAGRSVPPLGPATRAWCGARQDRHVDGRRGAGGVRQPAGRAPAGSGLRRRVDARWRPGRACRVRPGRGCAGQLRLRLCPLI